MISIKIRGAWTIISSSIPDISQWGSDASFLLLGNVAYKPFHWLHLSWFRGHTCNIWLSFRLSRLRPWLTRFHFRILSTFADFFPRHQQNICSSRRSLCPDHVHPRNLRISPACLPSKMFLEATDIPLRQQFSLVSCSDCVARSHEFISCNAP
jgi:hypothetical protein